jgi:hypothetical protein
MSYWPQLRIHACVDVAPETTWSLPPPPVDAPQLVPAAAPARPRPRRTRAGATILVRIVSISELYRDLGMTTSVSICKACAHLAEHPDVTSVGMAKNAHKIASTFGTGNLLIYMVNCHKITDPQYMALGLTQGCDAGDDGTLHARWTVLTAFGGETNPHTFEYVKSLLRGDDTARSKFLSSLVRGRTFVRPLARKFSDVYAALCLKRDAGEDPGEETLAAQLAESLFTFSEASKLAFLQLYGQHVQGMNCENL